MSTSVAPDQAFEVREKLAQLEASLLAGTPNMPVLLRDIHRTLKADPDVVTILSEEECNILVRGLKKQTATEIAIGAVKGKKKSMSKMQVGLDL
jgi:hypothetical protein